MQLDVAKPPEHELKFSSELVESVCASTSGEYKNKGPAGLHATVV